MNNNKDFTELPKFSMILTTAMFQQGFFITTRIFQGCRSFLIAMQTKSDNCQVTFFFTC